MKKLTVLTLLLLMMSPAVFAQIPDSASTEETILIFVRHAEKMDDGTADPSLNEKGKIRAQKLAGLMIRDHHIAAIYSTPYKRTKETAKPLADQLEVEILEYNFQDPNGFIQKLIEDYRGQEVLIVGHSNTTPMLVNTVLGTGSYGKLDEDEYSLIFIVQASDVGKAGVEQLSY